MDIILDNVYVLAGNDLIVVLVALALSYFIPTRPGQVLADLVAAVKEKSESSEVDTLKGLLDRSKS